MWSFTQRARRRSASVVAGLSLALGAAVLGPSAPGAATVHGSVAVLYAGSLVDLMQNAVAPGFARAAGDTVNGVAGGSDELASEIAAKTQRADVFISAAPSVNAKLEGTAKGGWVSWYARFASSPLELAYNRHSHFAAALRREPWWRVVTEPGFRLGRTDASVDPKGKLADQALAGAAAAHHEPALARLARATTAVYPEQTLVGRLQAGQLDAGFFYAVEARAAHLPTVRLAGTHFAAQYTVSILNRAPDPAAARAFVRYLLGPAGLRLLAANGLAVPRPVPVSGRRAAVPPALRAVFAHA